MSQSHLPTVPNISPDVARRAIEWILELQTGDKPADTHAAIRQWCASHPDHQKAWNHIEKLNQHFSILAGPSRAALAQRALVSTNQSRRHALKTLSLLMMAGGTAYVADQSGILNRLRSDYHTATGEQRTLMLTGGTEVTLNSGSAIRVEDQPQGQHLHLLEGEIYITTGGKSSAPLMVEVNQGTIRPFGTRFALRQLGTRCRLAVYEGEVELRPRDSLKSCLLQSGDSTEFDRRGWAAFTAVIANEDAWSQGMIVVRRMSLGQFIEELGRYRPGIMRVDPAIAGLPVSGTYPVTRTDQVLETLTAALPVKLRSVTRYWVTLVPA